MAEFGSYLEGDLTADVRRQLESHLAHCRTCQVLYDSTRKTLKIVTESGSFDLPETAARLITDEIMARIRKTSAA
jgi:dihydroneopterin aldolase